MPLIRSELGSQRVEGGFFVLSKVDVLVPETQIDDRISIWEQSITQLRQR